MLDLIFPKICRFCDSASDTDGVCSNCLVSGVRLINNEIVCQVCGAPPLSGGDGSEGEGMCGRCRRGDYGFRKARSVAYYDGILRDVLHLFKYEARLNLAGAICSLITENFPADFDPVDAVVPVPLHKNKLRAREYNQCAVMGIRVADFLGVAAELFALRKIEDTAPQVEMKGEAERRLNVNGAFSVENPQILRKKSILLIDDVFTTGSTVNECAGVLIRSGASSVQVLTLMRAVRN